MTQQNRSYASNLKALLLEAAKRQRALDAAQQQGVSNVPTETVTEKKASNQKKGDEKQSAEQLEKEAAAQVAEAEKRGVVPQHIVSVDQFNSHGNRIAKLMEMLCPNPVILISPPGSGKTKMCELLAEKLGYKRVGVMFNSQSPAKTVFGNFYPPRTAGAGILEWMDGRMVRALRPDPACQWKEGQPKNNCSCQKTMIHIDEFNRQEEDVQVRWLTVLEDTGRWMHLVEHHQEEFPVHPNVWVVGTMNPENQSASINPIEPALLDRLRIIEVEKPIVNEIKVLQEILPKPMFDDHLPKQLMSMATDSRRNPETAISTRALVMIAKSLVYGLKVSEAIKVNVMNTTVSREDWATIDSLYNSFFGQDLKYGGKLPPSMTGV